MKWPERILVGSLVTALLLSSSADVDAKSYSSGGGHSYSSHSSSSSGSHSSSSGSRSSSSGSSRSSSGSSTRTSSSGGSSRSSSGTSTRSSGGSSTYSSGGSASKSSSSGGSSQKSTSSSGNSSTFSSGSGKSYSSGSGSSSSSRSSSGSSSTDRHSYTSGKSYSSGSGNSFTPSSGSDVSSSPTKSYRQTSPSVSPSPSPSFNYDSAAAQARQQDVSKANYNEYKRSQAPPLVTATEPPPVASAPSYQGKPPPIIPPSRSYAPPTAYVPDSVTISTRPVRINNYYGNYYSRPYVSYRDPYNSFFWWWLLDRSLDDRAYWAYHHRYDMDPARYNALMATDQQLESRVEQLEAQQAPRDGNFVPAGIDRDLMYSDQYVTRNYHNRPTPLGLISFWVLAVPLALAVTFFFIWLIWFKRWPTAA